MTPCLGPEEFVDLVDGVLPPARRQHVDTCAACQATAAEVREALAIAVADEVPEPSALFWPSLNARVRAEIATQQRVTWRRWLRWELALPVGAAAALVVAALMTSGRAGRAPSTPAELPVATVTPAVASEPDAASDAARESDAALALVVDLSQALPDGGWDMLGITSLPELADAAQVLSAEERVALAALLRTAVERSKS